jgi:hypothetical protein
MSPISAAPSSGVKRHFILLALAVFCLASSCHFVDISPFTWLSLQIFKSIFKTAFKERITNIEEQLWLKWEAESYASSNFNINSSLLLDIPLYSINDLSSTTTSIDFKLPFIIRNASQTDTLSLERLSSPPLSDLSIDYFADARKKVLIPDSHDTLGVIMKLIQDGGPEKIGTQMIVQAFPSIVKDFISENKEWLVVVFGANRVQTWSELGVTLTTPVFVSRGRSTDTCSNCSGGNEGEVTTRTDLHCEPISNVVLQTAG